VRPGPLGLAHHSALIFLRAGRQTIVFSKARVAVELLLTSLREAFREGRGPLKRIRGYRGGYLPTERRDIEAGLRTGEVLGVVSTNALGWASTSVAGRVRPGRLSGHDRRHVAADGLAPSPPRGAWPSSSPGRGALDQLSPTTPSS
jgi:hypothetical protein